MRMHHRASPTNGRPQSNGICNRRVGIARHRAAPSKSDPHEIVVVVMAPNRSCGGCHVNLAVERGCTLTLDRTKKPLMLDPGLSRIATSSTEVGHDAGQPQRVSPSHHGKQLGCLVTWNAPPAHSTVDLDMHIDLHGCRAGKPLHLRCHAQIVQDHFDSAIKQGPADRMNRRQVAYGTQQEDGNLQMILKEVNRFADPEHRQMRHTSLLKRRGHASGSQTVAVRLHDTTNAGL